MAILELSWTKLTKHKAYEIIKYDLPLIFVSSKINVGLVVADFIIQSLMIEQITEVMMFLTILDTGSTQRFFTVDYFEGKTSAITNVYSECKMYLCDF